MVKKHRKELQAAQVTELRSDKPSQRDRKYQKTYGCLRAMIATRGDKGRKKQKWTHKYRELTVVGEGGWTTWVRGSGKYRLPVLE